MRDSFKDVFQKELDVEVDFGPIVRFNMVRTRSDIKCFVFVEGSTDKTFYENTNISDLSDHAFYLFRATSDQADKEDYVGKEAVYYSLKRIVGNEKLNALADRCRFIVDRDYDKVKRSKRINLRPNDYARVFVTKGHSMESFFVERDNLEIVIKHVGLNIEEFLKTFDVYTKEISEFCAYRGVITEYHRSGANLSYRRKYKDEEIMLFDFSKKDFWIGKSKMLEECARMKRAIERYSNLRYLANSLQKEIASDRMKVRGHDAFLFLEQYIEQKAHKKIAFPIGDKSERKAMIGRFRVELTK